MPEVPGSFQQIKRERLQIILEVKGKLVLVSPEGIIEV
jgi:hypothetical protein